LHWLLDSNGFSALVTEKDIGRIKFGEFVSESAMWARDPQNVPGTISRYDQRLWACCDLRFKFGCVDVFPAVVAKFPDHIRLQPDYCVRGVILAGYRNRHA
jgi:hypothetical protein